MKKFYLLITLLFSFLFISCNEIEDVVKDERVIEDIVVDVSTIPNEITISEFDIEDIKFKVSFSDDSYKDISVTKEMLNQSEIDKLLLPGTHTIFFTYEGITRSFIITLTDNSQIIPEKVRTAKDALEAKVGTEVEIQGEVTAMYQNWNDNYGNMSVYITDSTGTILAFRITEKVEVGYIIKVTGVIGEFNGVNQIAQGSTTEIISSDVTVTPEKVTTVIDALGAKVGNEVEIQGEVTEIYLPWDDNYGNMSVYLTDNTGTIIAFRITEKVEVGYIIKVTGLIGVYNGINQIAQGSITEIIDGNTPIVSDLLTINQVKVKADEAGSQGALVSFVGTVVGFDSMGYAHVGDETGLIYVRAKDSLLVKDAKVKITGYTTIYAGSAAYPEYTRQIKVDGISISAYDGDVTEVKDSVVVDGSELIDNNNYLDTNIHGNIITVCGIVEVGPTKYTYYLNDDGGNHIVAIHHYSNGFERFDSLNGRLVTLTGVVYRYYSAEEIWSLQLIGLTSELIATEPVETDTINFVMINDTHGAFIDDSGDPGIARVSSAIDELTGLNGDYIKIANGDIFQGSYVSNVLYGRPLIDALNKMEFDVFVLGNHEFDWGLEKIAVYKDGNAQNGEADFPFLGANIIDKKTNKIVDWLEPYTIINYGDYKVGIIGVMGETHESSILTENVSGYDFTDASDAVEKYAVELRSIHNCDVVVVASHDYDEYTNYEISMFTGDAEIDAIFCAHTHQKISTSLTRSDGYKIPVVQNYDKNGTMSEVILRMNNDEASSYTSNFYYPSNYSIDSDLESVIALYQNQIDEGNRVLGYVNYSLNKETLGMYATASMISNYDVDVAIINTGGVRATINSGDVTVSEVFNVFPFNNEVILTSLKGSDLISLYNENSSYLYFNEGFSVNSINRNSIYEIAVIDYVFTSPYYSQFKNVEFVDTDVVMRDLLIEYIDNMY